MQSQLSQTVFQVEPLKNIVGIGETAAYQIILNPGAKLGTFGAVHVPAYAEICNDPEFDMNSARIFGTRRLRPWLQRALATLKS